MDGIIPGCKLRVTSRLSSFHICLDYLFFIVAYTEVCNFADDITFVCR